MKKLIITVVVGFVLSSCSDQPKPEAVQKEEQAVQTVTLTTEQMKQAGIETGTVGKQQMAATLKVNGVVDVPPQNIVSISFPMGGYLKTTKLLPGLHVNKGEVIAIMEDQALIQLQQDYLMAQARLVYLEKEFKRQQELNESQVNAEKVFQQVQSDYASQRVLVKGYSEKLRLIGMDPDKLTEQTVSRNVPIYSPINGFVSKVNVNIGKFVNPSDVLFELINPEDIHAALTVFEKDISRIAIGQKVMVSFADEPGREYPCEVILVSRNVDATRSGIIHCHFESKPRQLLPGMFLNAKIHMKREDCTAVGEEAVVRSGNSEYLVEQTANGQFALLAVETGVRENGFVEVKSKTDLTDRKIVVKNAYAVLSKMMNATEE
jgi:membrane fusion protein, heavy metal efflux system